MNPENEDPRLKLLNIDSSARLLRQSSGKPKYIQLGHRVDESYLLEPWQDSEESFIRLAPQENHPPQSQSLQKRKQFCLRTPMSRGPRRQGSIEQQSYQGNNTIPVITRPASCHNGTFVDLGMKNKTLQYNKVVDKLFEIHKSPRKNSTIQYRQLCLKNILNVKKNTTPAKQIIKVVVKKKNNESFSWHDYNRQVQLSVHNTPSPNKKKNMNTLQTDKDQLFKQFRLKLNTLTNKPTDF